MIIKTVKISGNGFLLNNKIGVPNHVQNIDYQEIQKWIAKGGIVEPEFTTSELKSNLVEKIKIQAATRIDSAYPEWRQRNYMASVSEIHNKEIVAMKTIPFVAQYQLTAEEKRTLKDADTCKKFITAIRLKSNQLETALDTMTSAELEAFDPSNDSNWQ